MFGIGKNKQVVGLDIGSSAVKVLELKKTGKGLEVAKLGVENLAPDIVVDGSIVDTGAVINTIMKVFADHKIKTAAVATSVSGHSVIVKRLPPMAPMSDEELDEAVQVEAAQSIPFDITEVNLDHQTLEG